MAFVPIYILILGGTIVVDYFAGIYLEKIEGKGKKVFLILSLIANIGILCVFKYYNFINENIGYLFRFFVQQNPIPYLNIILPIGLSFHTFQAMSYTIEVYRGNQKAEKNFGIYALYVMFYPQLVAGPIERPQNMLHQFHEKHQFNWTLFKAGLMQMAWGMFKKVAIADRIAMAIDPVFDNPWSQSGTTLLVSAIFYSFQIYCDFSGYSDIGIGAAKTMGFDLMRNFDSPYLSTKISEFWKRWHISLSTWFKDYLYIPLGGNRVKKAKVYSNLFIVFLISGIWHGANWTFAIWGALHGSFLVIENIFSSKFKYKNSSIWMKSAQMLFVFILVSIAWVFFRSPTVKQAYFVLVKIFSLSFTDTVSLGVNLVEGLFILFLVFSMMLKEKRYPGFNIKNNGLFVLTFAATAIACYFFGVFGNVQFIYFQF
jgi:D-alanyl-lipoteichoic acid acyltransferase DltB (MBOAT superfamily)